MTLKKACILALSLGLSMARVAHADDDSAVASYKKLVSAASKYQKGQEEKGTFKERIEGQRKAWEEYKKAHEEYEAALGKAKKGRESALGQVEKDEGNIMKMEGQLNNDTDAHNRYVKEWQGKGKDVTSSTVFGLFDSAEQSRYQAIREQMRKSEEKLVETRKRIEDGKAKAEANRKAVVENQKKMEDTAKKVEAYAKGFNVVKDEQSKAIDAAAGEAASQLFRDMQKDSYDSELLLTNYDTLLNKGKLNEIQLNALQAQADQHLKNTMLGKYVQARIDEAMQKENLCKLVNKCEPPAVYDAKKVSDLERRVNDLAGKAKEEVKQEDKSADDSDNAAEEATDDASAEKTK